MGVNDHVAIVGLLNTYALALDARQWDLFDQIFTRDVTADFGPAGATWTGLNHFKQGFAAFHDTLDNHQHTMSNAVVRVDGDAARAFSYGSWLLIRDAAGGGPNWLGNGWYDDELVLTEHGWRIRTRIVRLSSWTGNPQVPRPVGQQQPDMDTHSLQRSAAAGEVLLLGPAPRARDEDRANRKTDQ